MISAKIILDKRRKTKNGFPIKIRVQFKTAKYINLNEYSKLKDWGVGILKTHPDFKRLNHKLKKRELQLIQDVDYCNENNLNLELSVLVIKKGIKDLNTEILILKERIKKLQGYSGIGMLTFFDTIISERKNQGKSYLQFYNTKKQFSKYLFTKDISLNDIDYEWLNNFRNYKLKNNCGVSGLRYYLKTLNTVFSEAQKRNSLNIKAENPVPEMLKKLIVVKKDIELPETQQLKEFLSYIPKQKTSKINKYKMLRNRDLFRLQILIGGHDYVELARLEWKNIKNGRITFYRYKLRSRNSTIINNIILPEALKIIEKYGNEKGKRIFDFIPDPEKDIEKYHAYRRNVWRSLNTLAGFKIGTKMPRYIFRSHAGELSIDLLIISQIMGHTPEGVSFRYQRRLPNDIVDRALEAVCDMF